MKSRAHRAISIHVDLNIVDTGLVSIMLIEYLVARSGVELSKRLHKYTPEYTWHSGEKEKPRTNTVRVWQPTVCTSSAKSWLASQHIQLLSILAFGSSQIRWRLESQPVDVTAMALHSMIKTFSYPFSCVFQSWSRFERGFVRII